MTNTPASTPSKSRFLPLAMGFLAVLGACGAPADAGEDAGPLEARMYIDSMDGDSVYFGVFAGSGACEAEEPPAPYSDFSLSFWGEAAPIGVGPLPGALLWDCRGEGCESATTSEAFVDVAESGALTIIATGQSPQGQVIEVVFDVVDCTGLE